MDLCTAHVTTGAARKKARTKRAVKETPYQKSVGVSRLQRVLIAASSARSVGLDSAAPQPHLAAQMVPAGFVIGTPTELPYSVHEPS